MELDLNSTVKNTQYVLCNVYNPKIFPGII